VKKPRIAFSDAAIADILEQSDWYEAQADRSLAQRWEEAVTDTLLRQRYCHICRSRQKRAGGSSPLIGITGVGP
jgi:plasmid stabilization system protein ParE